MLLYSTNYRTSMTMSIENQQANIGTKSCAYTGKVSEAVINQQRDILYQRVQEKLDSMDNDQQKHDFFDSMVDEIESFVPKDYTEIEIPRLVSTKGRPKNTKNSRLPSSFEIKDKEAKQSKRKRKSGDDDEDHHCKNELNDDECFEFPLPLNGKDLEFDFLEKKGRIHTYNYFEVCH